MASTTSTSTPATTTRGSTSSNKDHQTQTNLNLSANFAHPNTTSSASFSTTTTTNPKSPAAIGYDHEVYLQLMAGQGETIPKTPNQIYREERALRRTTRALDPAILDPQGDPSPVDFECAETQGAKERLTY